MEEPQPHRCTICLTAPPGEPAQARPCSHEFCHECLLQWCRTRRQPKCPLCWAEISAIARGGAEQPVPPPDKLEEEGPDLGCLDHSYFRAESDRLLCRARQAQMHVVRAAYGCGRQGHGAADDAADTLQQVIDTLAGYKEDMRREVPFQPESVLHELYSLEQIVSSIAAGSWAAGGGGGPGGGGDAPAARFSADDAAAGFHEWQDHSDDSQGGWSDDDGLDSRTRQRLERASLGSTPGRRPVPGGGGSARRRSSGAGAGLAARGSSGSLSGGGGGSGRRR